MSDVLQGDAPAHPDVGCSCPDVRLIACEDTPGNEALAAVGTGTHEERQCMPAEAGVSLSVLNKVGNLGVGSASSHHVVAVAVEGYVQLDDWLTMANWTVEGSRGELKKPIRFPGSGSVEAIRKYHNQNLPVEPDRAKNLHLSADVHGREGRKGYAIPELFLAESIDTERLRENPV